MDKKAEDIFRATEHAARARLSRVIRNSEAGWLFYSPSGTAYHLLTDEAQKLERRGLRIIAKCGWLATELAKLPVKSFKLALAALAFHVMAGVTFGRAYNVSLGGFIGSYIFPSLILFALFFAFLRPLIALALRSTIMLSWQIKEARLLRKQGRGAVPGKIERKHLRYNLFRMGIGAALAVLTVRFVIMWTMTPSQLSARGFTLDIICLAIIALCIIPARLIDVTHIRRKWLD